MRTLHLHIAPKTVARQFRLTDPPELTPRDNLARRRAMPQSAAESVGRMKEMGIRWFRIDLLRETPEQVVMLVEQYRRVLDGTDDGKQTWKRLKAVNQLGVTRGTLNLL